MSLDGRTGIRAAVITALACFAGTKALAQTTLSGDVLAPSDSSSYEFVILPADMNINGATVTVIATWASDWYLPPPTQHTQSVPVLVEVPYLGGSGCDYIYNYPQNDFVGWSLDRTNPNSTATASITVGPGKAVAIAGSDCYLSDNFTFHELVTWNVQLQGNIPSPTNLQATQVGFNGNQIQLTWDYGSDSIDGFIIERQTPLGSWLPPVPPETTISLADACTPSTIGASSRTCAFPDTNAASFATTSYRVRAYQGSESNQSDNSNTATSFQFYFASASCPASGIGPCTQLIQWPGGRPVDNALVAKFTPDSSFIFSELAQNPLLNYDHFNWISSIMYLPPVQPGDELRALSNPNVALSTLNGPIIDPPYSFPGGYTYQVGCTGDPATCPGGQNYNEGADLLVYYLDEQSGFNPLAFLNNYILNASGLPVRSAGDGTTLEFLDHPHFESLQSSDYMQFATTLVGVSGPIGSLSSSTNLATFTWSTNNRIAGITVAANSLTSDQGAGGIFGLRVVPNDELPSALRSLLVQAGVQGIPTTPYVDTNPPMTAAFLSGQQGTNGWYTGPVNVMLIAIDIDGPSDVASTSYNIDGGGLVNYTAPFTVSGDGVHTIAFGSVDLAGNVETPRPSQTIDIDATPPMITVSANPSILWPPNGKMVSVTVSGTITDATSGVNGNSAKFAVVDEYGSVQPSGFVTLGANGSYSFTIALQASRLGTDKNGRTYTITVTAQDNAGNQSSGSTIVLVPHDQGN